MEKEAMKRELWENLNEKAMEKLTPTNLQEEHSSGGAGYTWSECVGCEGLLNYVTMLPIFEGEGSSHGKILSRFEELIKPIIMKVEARRKNTILKQDHAVDELSVGETRRINEELEAKEKASGEKKDALETSKTEFATASDNFNDAMKVLQEGNRELDGTLEELKKLNGASGSLKKSEKKKLDDLKEITKRKAKMSGDLQAKNIAGLRFGFMYQYVDVIVAFTYTGILRCFAKALACKSPDYSYLIAVPTIECWTGLHLVMVPAAILGLVVVYPAAMLTRPLFQALNANLNLHFDYNYLFVFSQLQTFLLVLASLAPESPTILVLLCLFVDLVLVWYFWSRPEERNIGHLEATQATAAAFTHWKRSTYSPKIFDGLKLANTSKRSKLPLVWYILSRPEERNFGHLEEKLRPGAAAFSHWKSFTKAAALFDLYTPKNAFTRIKTNKLKRSKSRRTSQKKLMKQQSSFAKATKEIGKELTISSSVDSARWVTLACNLFLG
jgi:hypothetical protein